jgi:integrase
MVGDTQRARDRLGRLRSPASLPGSGAGVPSKHKGRRRSPVVLSPAEVRQIMDFWAAQGVAGVRNRAIIRLIYWEGLQIDQALRLEPSDWDRERGVLTLPPRKNAPRTREGTKRKKVVVSPSSRDLLAAWWDAREGLHAGPQAPLFCQVWKSRSNFTTSSSSFRQSLRTCANKIGLPKPLTTEGLRASGRAHRLEGSAGLSREMCWAISMKTCSRWHIQRHSPAGVVRES